MHDSRMLGKAVVASVRCMVVFASVSVGKEAGWGVGADGGGHSGYAQRARGVHNGAVPGQAGGDERAHRPQPSSDPAQVHAEIEHIEGFVPLILLSGDMENHIRVAPPITSRTHPIRGGSENATGAKLI